MDDIVAIKVRDAKEAKHYFLTWGRIFDRVEAKQLESVFAKHVSKFGLKRFTEVSVCDSLQEASASHYFHEAFFHISQEKIPFGKSAYGPWRAKAKRRQMLMGTRSFSIAA